MNVMTQVHPFLDGKTKRMLIGGKWLEAASGKTFETRNPATGEILAHVAERRRRHRPRGRCGA
jgi:aldehyde dehydrogenase (NAD+)